MLPLHELGQLAENALVSLGTGLVDQLPRILARPGRQAGEHRVLVDPVVPGGEMAHLGIAGDMLAIGPRGLLRSLRSLLLVAAHEAHGHGGAGCQALEVPLPGAGEDLVEVVDGEHQVALGRAEDAEVRDMHVATRVHLQAGHRRRGEVGGHHRGRAAQEGEGRGQHSREAHRHELLGTAEVLRLEDRNGIGPIGALAKKGVALARHRLAQALAGRLAFAHRPSRRGEPVERLSRRGRDHTVERRIDVRSCGCRAHVETPGGPSPRLPD